MKVLVFKNKPTITDLEGLSINGSSFQDNAKGFVNHEGNAIVMDIPQTFRFSTKLEVVETNDNRFILIMTQILTRGVDYWHMDSAFDRIGFRNPEIKEQMQSLCDELVNRGLVEWVEDE